MATVDGGVDFLTRFDPTSFEPLRLSACGTWRLRYILPMYTIDHSRATAAHHEASLCVVVNRVHVLGLSSQYAFGLIARNSKMQLSIVGENLHRALVKS